jgi:beta-aspartyl-peptidase (threonine type)
MKKYLGMWIVLLFVSSGFAEDPKSDQEKAVRQVLDDQVTAWNKGDLESFMKGYWDSEKLTFYSGKNKKNGWKETLERYKERYQGEGKEMGKLKFAGLEITKLGDGVMLVKGEWEVQMTKEKVNGLFTLIMKETKSGWKIIHDHTS